MQGEVGRQCQHFSATLGLNQPLQNGRQNIDRAGERQQRRARQGLPQGIIGEAMNRMPYRCLGRKEIKQAKMVVP